MWWLKNNNAMLKASGQYMTAANNAIEEPSAATKWAETVAFTELKAKATIMNELTSTYVELNKKTEKVARLYATLVVYQDAYTAARRFGTKTEAKEAREKKEEAFKKHEAERHAMKWTVRHIEKLTRNLEK